MRVSGSASIFDKNLSTRDQTGRKRIRPQNRRRKATPTIGAVS